MKNAKLIGIRPGNVKTYGDVDLCDPKSDFHKQRELGIQELEIDGALEISSMKLLYGEENAKQAVELLDTFVKVKEKINKIAEELTWYYLNPTKNAGPNREVIEKLFSIGTVPEIDAIFVQIAESSNLPQDLVIQGLYEVLRNHYKTKFEQDNKFTVTTHNSSNSFIDGQNTITHRIITNYFSTFLKHHYEHKGFQRYKNRKYFSS